MTRPAGTSGHLSATANGPESNRRPRLFAASCCRPLGSTSFPPPPPPPPPLNEACILIATSSSQSLVRACASAPSEQRNRGGNSSLKAPSCDADFPPTSQRSPKPLCLCARASTPRFSTLKRGVSPVFLATSSCNTGYWIFFFFLLLPFPRLHSLFFFIYFFFSSSSIFSLLAASSLSLAHCSAEPPRHPGLFFTLDRLAFSLETKLRRASTCSPSISSKLDERRFPPRENNIS